MAFTKRADVGRALDYAETDANWTELEKIYAETLEARDISIAESIIYPDTAAGLAATAEGGYFVVPDTATDELVFYREETGVAVEKVRIGYRLPFVGGTLTGALNEAPPVTIASAATVDIGAAASNTVIVSGTAQITALGTIAAGAIRYVRATGAFTLVHNATSLILYGSNIVATVGEVFRFESLGAGNWRLTGRHYAGPLARTDLANTFVNGQIISSSDAGAGEVIGLRLDRNSASPAAADYGVSVRFGFLNSAAAYIGHTGLRPQLVDPTAGAETTKIDFLTISGGTSVGAAAMSSGMTIGAPTGGDKGVGTLNATNLYVNNSAVLKQNDIFVSTDQTITLAGALTLAHGLGVAPRAMQVLLVNTTAELGYSIGDVVLTASNNMPAVWPDATNINVRYGSAAPSVAHKTTGVLTAITAANWNARFFAIK